MDPGDQGALRAAKPPARRLEPVPASKKSTAGFEGVVYVYYVCRYMYTVCVYLYICGYVFLYVDVYVSSHLYPSMYFVHLYL